MTQKQIENKFTKVLHPSLKNNLFINIVDYSFDTDEGIVEFLDEDFNILYKFDPRMFKHLYWYLQNPDVNYQKALNSNNPLDNVLAIIDKNTGKRSLDDWHPKNHNDELITFFYNLRKKFQ